MIKVIGGITYNTNTSISLAVIDNGTHFLDNAHRFESLCCTKSGYYFLYGQGKPFSMYESWHIDQTKPISTRTRIMPISKAQAEEWVSTFKKDKYKKLFAN